MDEQEMVRFLGHDWLDSGICKCHGLTFKAVGVDKNFTIVTRLRQSPPKVLKPLRNKSNRKAGKSQGVRCRL